MKYIRTKYEGILETQTTSKCRYAIRNKNVDGKNCYVTYLWDNWRNYHLIDFHNSVLFSYNSAQIFISDLMKENLNYQDLVIEISPYYKNCKQSDTIEELCDEFVGLIKDRSSDFIITKVIAHSLKELKDSLKTEFNGKTYYGKFDIIYGAIWTDKGLIYVAKMNENWDLELI